MELEEKGHQADELDGVRNESKEKSSVMDTIKDPAFRRKLFRWMCIPIGTFAIGIMDSQAGPTLHDLEIITSTSEETASLFFTAGNLGYLFGCFLGGLGYGKINSYLMMLVASVVAGLTCIASPYCFTFALMFLIRCIVGCFLGILLCTTIAEHMHIWGTKGEALLQLINFAYAVGGVVGPLIASPFLTDKETNNTLSHQNVTPSSLINFTQAGISILSHPNLTSSSLINLTEAGNSTLNQTTNVRYAFFIGGAVVILSAIPFLVALIVPDTAIAQSKVVDAVQRSRDKKLPFGVNIFMLATVFTFFFTYSSVELTFNSYIATFVVQYYEGINWNEGAYYTTFFWASFAAARFLSIFTSKYLTAIRLLSIHLSLAVVAFSGFLVNSALYSRIDALTVFTCAVGVACSAIYPASMSWVEAEITAVSGPVSAVILVGGSGGATVNPFVVGYLMDEVSRLWFCYALMVFLALALLSFMFLLLFNRLYVDKKYGPLREVEIVVQQNHSPIIRIDTVL